MRLRISAGKDETSPSRFLGDNLGRGKKDSPRFDIRRVPSENADGAYKSIPMIRNARQDGVRAINLLQREDQRHLVLES